MCLEHVSEKKAEKFSKESNVVKQRRCGSRDRITTRKV